ADQARTGPMALLRRRYRSGVLCCHIDQRLCMEAEPVRHVSLDTCDDGLGDYLRNPVADSRLYSSNCIPVPRDNKNHWLYGMGIECYDIHHDPSGVLLCLQLSP